MAFRSGFLCILGRPNAGKSTLLNALVGEKIAIVSPKPQTTRNRIQGILNIPKRKGRPAAQVILIDTPGVHKPDSALGRKMMHEVHAALEGSDLVLLIADATLKPNPQDDSIIAMVKKSGTPAFLLLNKVDAAEKPALLPLMAHYSRKHEFAAILPISALKKEGLDELLDAVVRALPEAPHYFAADQITDQPARFMVAEVIREQILMSAQQEVPHATTVVIDQFEEGPRLTRIAATIFCERDGQKAILVGRAGAMLNKIGTAARLRAETMLGTRIFLELFVKVTPGWRDSRQFVEEIDWRRQLEALTGARPIPALGKDTIPDTGNDFGEAAADKPKRS